MKLTNEKIRKDAIDQAIDGYLLEGETKSGMLKKFEGDSTALIQFLRKRAFAEFDNEAKPSPPVAAKPSPAKKNEKQAQPERTHKPAVSKTAKPTSSSQNTLF